MIRRFSELSSAQRRQTVFRAINLVLALALLAFALRG